MMSACPKLSWEEKIQGLRLNHGQRRQVELLLANPVNHIQDQRFRYPAQMQPIQARRVETVQGIKLQADEEPILFLQMNYALFKVGVIKRKMLRQKAFQPETVRALLDWHQKYLEAQAQIVTSNLGLVLALSKRSYFSGMEITDLISEGSEALLRAVEKFDCGRGFKFSTYAWRVISKSFARLAGKQKRYHDKFPVQYDTEMEPDKHQELKREELHQDMVQEVRFMLANNRADLTGIEKTVVELRFNLNQANPAPMTLLSVGERLGLTKERIRQIQNHALAKLRLVAL